MIIPIKKNGLLFILNMMVASSLWTQDVAVIPDNIVPNHSFEHFSTVPIGWFYKGEHYTRLMKFWSSPTAASPDVFGPKVRIPTHWAAKDFGNIPPKSGWAMSGITTYGCTNGKPHCREYLQVRLSEPLVVGQTYHCEMYVSHLPRSLRINRLGFYFSDTPPTEKTDVPITAIPQVSAAEIVTNGADNWAKIMGTFKAETEAEFLTIGNFFSDEDTYIQRNKDDDLPYAYYYIDDVVVRKLPPYLPVPVKENDLTLTELSAGKTFHLKNILFDFNSWELHPRSFVELNKLLQIMRENPTLHIEIIGHTDNVGDTQYNKYLSRKRAKSVVLFLLNHQISGRRLKYLGKGESVPVSTNDTDAGRQQNRRVDFRIISM